MYVQRYITWTWRKSYSILRQIKALSAYDGNGEIPPKLFGTCAIKKDYKSTLKQNILPPPPPPPPPKPHYKRFKIAF